MPPKVSTIRRKMMRVIMLTCGIALILNCSVFFIHELIISREMAKNQLATLGEIVAANCTAALAFDNNEDAAEIMLALKAEKHVIAACLFDDEGKLFAKYPASLRVESIPVNIGTNGYNFNGTKLGGFQNVLKGNKTLGTLYLKSDITEVYSRFILYGFLALLFLILSIVFAYFFSNRLQKTISDPILELAKTARNISTHRNYAIRVAKTTDGELGALTDAFNHMLTEIETQNLEIISFSQKLEEKVQRRTSELEKANIILKQQNNFIETIIDSSVDLIGVFDRDYKIVVLNKKADEVYKVKRETLIGKHLLEGFPPLKGTTMVSNLARAFEGETVKDSNYLSSVSNRHFENFFIPLKDKNNEVYRVLVIGHDVTDIMEASEQLKTLNKELEKSNRDLEQFAYIASHDLQEPLRKIQIFSELGEKNIESKEMVQKYLEKINTSAKRMTELIKAVLNYSRLSEVDKEVSKIDLNVVLQSIQRDLELMIEEKSGVISSNDLPIISGNTQQINQLFLNLISNSLKFSEESPRISIRSSIVSSKNIRAEIKPDMGEYVELLFSDNGIGFEKQHASKIFAIFQRLNVSKNYSGTGIGLALCKKIVENHHGFISVDSVLGKGTSFYIYLPVDDGLSN